LSEKLFRIDFMAFLKLPPNELLDTTPLLNLMLTEALEIDDFHLLHFRFDNTILPAVVEIVILVDVEL